MTLQQIRDLGFGASFKTRGGISVRCDSCEAIVINGHPTHETGCAKVRGECHGCNAIVPVHVKYCEDCG